MRFSDLCIGDVFKAYGASFQKLPTVATADMRDANAFNTIACRPAFFGPTVSVELVRRGDFEDLAGHLKLLIVDRTTSA